MEIGEFLCSHFNIKNERKYTFSVYYMLYYFKKPKNATGRQKKICAVHREGAMTDQTCQKWFVKFLGTTDIMAK